MSFQKPATRAHLPASPSRTAGGPGCTFPPTAAALPASPPRGAGGGTYLPELEATLRLIDAKLAVFDARADLLLVLNDERAAVQVRIDELEERAD